MLSFFSSHYEKIILAGLLVVFAFLLVWQVNFLQAAQTRNVEAIINQAEPMTDQEPYDFTQEKYAADTIFSAKVAWSPTQKGPVETDLFAPYHLSLCPFCFNLIPTILFPEKGDSNVAECPISSCRHKLNAREKRLEKKELVLDMSVEADNDVNRNGVPDDWEKENKVYSELADAIDQDPDGDHFSTYEEYILKTNPMDPKSHPKYIAYQYVKSLNKTPIRDLRYLGLMSPSGKDVTKWEINIEFRENGRRAKTRQFKIGDTFDHMNTKFKILSIEPDDINNPGPGTVIFVAREGMNEKIRCEAGRNKVIYDPVETLVMRNAAYKKTIRCQVGKSFTLGEARTGAETYKVLQATGKSAVVEDAASGEKITLGEDTGKPVVERVEVRKDEPEPGMEPGLAAPADPDGLQRLDIPQRPQGKRKNKRNKN